MRTRSRSTTAKIPDQSSREVSALDRLVVSVWVSPIEADQDDTALRWQARSKRKFAKVGVGRDDDPLFPLREIQDRRIIGAGHRLLDGKHIMATLTQRRHGLAWHVLVREKAHALNP
jgi:hypothetical protein